MKKENEIEKGILEKGIEVMKKVREIENLIEGIEADSREIEEGFSPYSFRILEDFSESFRIGISDLIGADFSRAEEKAEVRERIEKFRSEFHEEFFEEIGDSFEFSEGEGGEEADFSLIFEGGFSFDLRFLPPNEGGFLFEVFDRNGEFYEGYSETEPKFIRFLSLEKFFSSLSRNFRENRICWDGEGSDSPFLKI